MKGKSEQARFGEMRRLLHLWFPHLPSLVDEYMDETIHQGAGPIDSQTILQLDFQMYCQAIGEGNA